MSDYNDGILPEPCLRMDTHFGDEYESIEFGDGTGYIKAAPILAKVGALHGEIDSLRDECGFLRERIASNARDANTCRMVPTRDKPRSKVPTLTCSECGWWTDEIGKTWNYCPSCGRRVANNETWGCNYERLMAKLGIEVDE